MPAFDGPAFSDERQISDVGVTLRAIRTFISERQQVRNM